LHLCVHRLALLGAAPGEQIGERASFRRRLRMQREVHPLHLHVVLGPEPLNTHGTEIAPGSDVVREDLHRDRLCHGASRWKGLGWRPYQPVAARARPRPPDPLDRGVVRAVPRGRGRHTPTADSRGKPQLPNAGFMLLALFTENDSTRRGKLMCKLCDDGIPQNHSSSRRDFLKATVGTGVAAAGVNLFAARPAAADGGDPPEEHGRRGRRYIIRGGSVMSMDPQVGDFARADVLVEGKKIVAVGPNLHAGDSDVIDARGRIVMPGFIDTHHHQFETALRSFLADGILINDNSHTPSGSTTYFEFILLTFAP